LIDLDAFAYAITIPIVVGYTYKSLLGTVFKISRLWVESEYNGKAKGRGGLLPRPS